MLFNGDCIEVMKTLDDKSIDLVFCDLPYGQTSCKWDCKVDLELFWKQIMRIKKLNTPIFFTTTTKFGVELIKSAPKKCFFRYDLVWVKSAPAGFLSARKMPLRKHEMVYVFYEKLPFYDLSSHKHKFIKDGSKSKEDNVYGIQKLEEKKKYDPSLPVSVVKEDYESCNKNERKTMYGNMKIYEPKRRGEPRYDPPLPVSVIKEEEKQVIKGEHNTYNTEGRKKAIVREKAGKYEPPLPVSVVKEPEPEPEPVFHGEIKKEGQIYNGGKPMKVVSDGQGHQYDPPLPTTMLEIKSTRGKHSTEKPVALMEWILKYYSKEGDVVLDPTMGSGSTGVACKNLNRDFIGIEMDDEIFKSASQRLEC